MFVVAELQRRNIWAARPRRPYLVSFALENSSASRITIDEVMSRPVTPVPETDRLTDALRLYDKLNDEERDLFWESRGPCDFGWLTGSSLQRSDNNVKIVT